MTMVAALENLDILTPLLVIHSIVVVCLIAIILVQKSSNDGFTGGGGAGNMDSFLSGRAAANLVTRTTSILATVFIVSSLFLAYLATHQEREKTLGEELQNSSKPFSVDTPSAPVDTENSAPKIPAGAVPVIPDAE